MKDVAPRRKDIPTVEPVTPFPTFDGLRAIVCRITIGVQIRQKTGSSAFDRPVVEPDDLRSKSLTAASPDPVYAVRCWVEM